MPEHEQPNGTIPPPIGQPMPSGRGRPPVSEKLLKTMSEQELARRNLDSLMNVLCNVPQFEDSELRNPILKKVAAKIEEHVEKMSPYL